MGKKREEKTTYDRQEELSNLLAKIEIKNKIVSGPAVFLSGDDPYTVMFSTSQKGAGWIEIEDGSETVKIWDNVAGNILTTDTVHAIKIKKSQLDGKTYRVGARHVYFKGGYSALKGSYAYSPYFYFRGTSKSDDINILVATDIHGSLERMKKAVGDWTDKADLVIMSGDIADQGETKESLKNAIIGAAAMFSKSEIPVIYTRGNHETRGEFSPEYNRYFRTDTGEMYFTTGYGFLKILVLDTGEDKEDSHPEYSGLVDFDSYRKKELERLDSLPKFKDDFVLCVAHNPYIENHFGDNWHEKIKRTGVRLFIGGHTHRLKYHPKGEYQDYPVIVAGGRGLNDKQPYIAMLLTVNRQTFRAKARDEFGVGRNKNDERE